MHFLKILLFAVMLALAAPAAATAASPGATTTAATNVTSQSATLNGVVNPNGESTTYSFQYGTTTSYGSQTANQTANGNGGKAANATISGLTPNTVYNFRLVATNASGSIVGANLTFRTTPVYAVPTPAPTPYVVPTPGPGPGPGQNAITIAATPAKITFGRTSVISGQLTGPKNVGVKVDLEDSAHPYTKGFKNTGATVLTDATGKYAFTVKPGLHTRYQVVAKASPPVTSAVVQVLVRQKVTFRVSASRVFRGQRVRFKGTVAPAHNGRIARIQRRTSTGSFKTVARATLRKSATAGRSAYSKRIRIRRKGTYRVRVSADADHATGTSRRRTIRIR